jgi:phospholipase/lecithinase/hemolysin
MRFSLTVAAACLLSGAPAIAAGSAVYVFGDSFVDAGNANLATGGATAPAELGYFRGRFSEGPTFADILQRRQTGTLTQPFLLGGRNFAVGGARAAGPAQFGAFEVPGLPQQAAIYQSVYGGFVDPNGIYIVNFGNNDVNAIQSGDTYGLSVDAYSDLFVGNITGAVSALAAGGAGKIIVLGVPNPLEPEGVALQARLDASLDLIAPFIGDRLVRFDFFDYFNGLLADPTQYGLPADLDFTTPCLTVRTAVNGKIDCTGFLSFDGTHVTAAVQRSIADQLSAQAGLPVPEPETWAMMIVGFGAVGMAMRRRRAIAA